MRLLNKILAYTILAFFILSGENSFAQPDKRNDGSAILKDSAGRIICNKQTPLYFYIATDTTGQDATSLRLDGEKNKPLLLEKQGRNQITHIGPNNRIVNKYAIFIEGEAPVTNFQSDADFMLINDTIIAASGFKVSLQAKDNIAGVKDVMVSVNKEPFQSAPEYIVFKEEKAHELRFYAIDHVGNIEDYNEFVVVIDDTPPATELNITKDNYENIVSGRSLFELVPKDKHGVKETYYWFNDENENVYKTPLPVSRFSEGYHNFYFYSVDKLGNTEEVNSFKFYVDKTPPIIFEEILGNSFIRDGREYSSGRSQLRLTAIDNKAGIKAIYYSIDGQDYQLYEGPVFLSMVAGDVDIRFYALDKVNNKSESSVQGTSTAVPYIDLNAPEISHSLRGPKIKLRDTLFVSTQTEIILNAIDHESGLNRIMYVIDNKVEKEYSEPFKLSEQGHRTVNYVAYDNVDNANTDKFTVFVDTTGPEIFVNYSIKPYEKIEIDNKIYDVYPQHLKVYLSASDIHTGTKNIRFSLNGSRKAEYRGPISGFNAETLNHLQIIAVDVLGNEESKDVKFFVK